MKPTASKRLEMEARTERVLDMKRMGFTYRMIAKELGVSVATVHKDLSRELRHLAAANEGKTDQWRQLELQKLDALEREAQRVLNRHHAVLYKGQVVQATSPMTGQKERLTDDAPILAAIRELRAISDQRARLLGLNAPQHLEHTGKESGPIKHEYDFSCLSDEELEAEIVRTAEGITGRAAKQGEAG